MGQVVLIILVQPAEICRAWKTMQDPDYVGMYAVYETKRRSFVDCRALRMVKRHVSLTKYRPD